MRTGEERIMQYQNISYAVRVRTSVAKACAQSGELTRAISHIVMADRMIMAYEDSLIQEGVRNCSQIARSLRGHVVKAFRSINLEAAA